MLTKLFLVATVCCAFASGAVFDPYSRRYTIFKDNMDTLLDTPTGSTSCSLISGLNALSTKGGLNTTHDAIWKSWVSSMETTIVKNPSITTKKAKFQLIAAEFEKFRLEQSFIFSKVQYFNISSWGPFEAVTSITTEWNFATSLELVVATSTKGNCKLFDLLLSACSGDSEKHTAISEFIESDLKVIVSDKTKTQKDVIKAVFKALKTKFFVGSRVTWMTYFYTLKLDGYFAFSQWNEAAVTFERETSIEVTLSGQGMSCPFILSLNATLSMTSYTTTQKGFIKQLINFFTQQWTTVTTKEERMIIISKKFSESIDLSYGYFACLNSIEIQGFGSFWKLIMLSCQISRIPVSCGCPVPTLSDETTTVAATTTIAATTEMPTTEMPTTEMSTEMPTTEMSTEWTTSEGTTEFSTEASSSGSTWDSTFSSITFPSTTQGCSCSCEM